MLRVRSAAAASKHSSARAMLRQPPQSSASATRPGQSDHTSRAHPLERQKRNRAMLCEPHLQHRAIQRPRPIRAARSRHSSGLEDTEGTAEPRLEGFAGRPKISLSHRSHASVRDTQTQDASL